VKVSNPTGYGFAVVAAGVDLVADVVVVQHGEQHRADLELVPVALEFAGVVPRQASGHPRGDADAADERPA
jgi:hypothetical protein